MRSILGSLLHGRISGSLRKTRGPTSGAFRHTHKPGVDLGWGNPCGKRQTRKRLNVGPQEFDKIRSRFRGLTPEGRISATRGRGLALSHSRYPVFSCRSRSRTPGRRRSMRSGKTRSFAAIRNLQGDFHKMQGKPGLIPPRKSLCCRQLDGLSLREIAGRNWRVAGKPSTELHNNSLRNHIILPRWVDCNILPSYRQRLN